MVSVIADILKSKLADLDWIERFGGLVVEAKKADFHTGGDGTQSVVGYPSYPVACDVNTLNCWENGVFKNFEPDSSKSAIAFFVDNGGATMQGFEGAKMMFMKISFDIRFLCWLNMKRLGEEITNAGCYASGRVAPYVLSQLVKIHSRADIEAVFGVDSVEARVFQGVEVTGWQQLVRSPNMFQPFSFAAKTDYFIWPYDYFGLRLTGTFVVNRNCLPELYEAPFVADESECLPVETPANARLVDNGDFRSVNGGDFRIYET